MIVNMGSKKNWISLDVLNSGCTIGVYISIFCLCSCHCWILISLTCGRESTCFHRRRTGVIREWLSASRYHIWVRSSVELSQMDLYPEGIAMEIAAALPKRSPQGFSLYALGLAQLIDQVHLSAKSLWHIFQGQRCFLIILFVTSVRVIMLVSNNAA